jgi:hypothetical protein
MSQNKSQLKFFSKENLWLVIFGYLIAVFAARVFVFLTSFALDKPLRVIIRDVHYHHYLYFGFLPILIAFAFYLKSRQVNSLSSFLFGLGGGFVIDEASLLIFSENIDYWSLFNFGAIVFGLALLNILFFVFDRQKTKETELLDFDMLSGRIRRIVRLSEKAFFSRFGPVSKKNNNLPARNYILILFVFLSFMFLLFYFAGKELGII